MLGTCLHLAVLLFLVFDSVVGGAPPVTLPAKTAFARMPDPSLPVRVTGESVVAVAGSSQSTPINTAFPTALVALVLDPNMQPVSGETVTFIAPSGSGGAASGTFPGGSLTVDVLTDGGGFATAPTFTANGNLGIYPVHASV